MKKSITVLIILLVFLSFVSNVLARTISRNETVYVNLDDQGNVKKTEVVTWLRTDNKGLSQDVTILKDVKNLRGTDIPQLTADGKLTFTVPAKDIFYGGTTTKNLPVKINIQYRLNGKAVKRNVINVKSGKLEIIIGLKNKTSTLKEFTYREVGTGNTKIARDEIPVPFIVMVSTDLDIEQFNNVVAPEGAFAVVGRTMKMNWICFPYPEATVKLRADIKNAKIPSILFSVIPKFPPLPEMDVESKLNQIYDGVDKVGTNLVKLENGANQLNDGQRQMLAALKQVNDGTGQLILASNAQMEIINGAIKINEGMCTKITPLTKIPFVSGEAIKAKHYLDIQRELLTLATQGGPFSPEILTFLKEQGKDTPPVKEFPGIKVTTDGITKLHDGSLQMIDGAKKLEDGSRQLQAGAAQIKREGTDTIKERMVAGADPIMRKLASIETAKQLVLKYDRFAGKPSPVKSSVEIIMKTPDEAANIK
ncbi:MAG: hypothetical protein CVU62_08890 [Deltaproteobacteria bacterium HGW-Deltaproteobacteria-2]|nr:MAG: hypothetical protein CVU62_08890 [Deltaproteobacteria bacterium HGW-Deltaproteobacteria-2]